MNKMDANTLRLGSFFLASGGGFESFLGQLMFQKQLEKNQARIISLDSLKSDELVVAISYMGCPAIEAEKTYSFSHFEKIIEKMTLSFQKKIRTICMWSVAGGGSFVPIFLSSHFDISVLDADLTGRCFPELQMISTNLADIPTKKAYGTNLMGDMFEIECRNYQALERHARQLTISSGGSCLVIPHVLTGEEAKRGLIAGSLTKALTIGQIIQDTHDLGTEEACGMITEYTKGKFVGVGGVVCSSGLNLPHPFTRHIVIKNAEEDRTWEIWMENEFNLLFENGELIAEVPDIITLCDVWTREPLTINQLHLNENVAILTTPAPDIWYTERGLALVRTQDHQAGKIAICGPSLSVLKKIA